MIISKMALPRRTFLRGAGVTLALPLLDAMVPALTALTKTAASPVPRLGCVYIPNGVAMGRQINHWKPTTEGAAFEFSPCLQPFERFREQMVVVSGLSAAQAESMGDGNGDHTRGTAAWLNASHPRRTEGADLLAGTTIDQVAAREIGKDTPLPSLELGIEHTFEVGNCENGYSCVYRNVLAWRTPTTPLPTEPNPRIVFERLFGDGGTPEQRRARMQKTGSILDSVTDEMAHLQKTLGPDDRTRVSDYFEATREVERRIEKVEARIDEDELPALERPVGIPGTFDEHCKLMFDLQCLAYQADITRVFTLLLGRESSQRAYPEIGIPQPHHATSHHRDDPETLARYAKIIAYESSQVAYFMEKLRSTPDGDGNLLDNTMLLYGAGLSNPNEHAHIDMPLVLLGGAAGQLKGNRHLAYPADTPMANLLVSMLGKLGVPVDDFGDSTGPLVDL
jgi:hypothetical protein